MTLMTVCDNFHGIMKVLLLSILAPLFCVAAQTFDGLAGLTTDIEEYITPIEFDCSQMGDRHKKINRNKVVIHWHNTRTNRAKVFRLHKAFSHIEKEFDFDRHEKTYVYIHGYGQSAYSASTLMLKNALETLKNTNYFIVDYSRFTEIDFLDNSESYSTAVSSLYGVGQLLGDFLAALVKRGLRRKDLYVFGFSLGAQVAGYTARRFYERYGKKLYRITGLDPAGPCFNDANLSEQISSSDASYVDIYHTDMGVIGTVNSLGNATFFLNSGGPVQSSCIPLVLLSELCSHVDIFSSFWTQSITNPLATMALECDSYENFKVGKCYGNRAVTPGFFSTPTQGSFYIVYDFDLLGQLSDEIEIEMSN